MGLVIESGVGNGYSAMVDSDNRLSVHSVGVSTMSHKSETGNTFGFSTGLLTVTTTEGYMLYIKNTDTTNKRWHVDKISIFSNGGSTSYNKPLYGKMYFNATEPTANNTAVTASNMNVTSGTVANLDVYKWDEVGSGMTIASAGEAFSGVFSQGMSIWDIDGALILGLNDTMAISFQGVEITEASVLIMGYFDVANHE
jgi:hypothetical protein